MLKAKAQGKAGPLYIIGLNADNMRELQKRNPISFAGEELGVPGHWFLLAAVRDADDLKRHHDHFAVEGKHNHTIGIDKSAWATLKRGEAVTLPGLRMKMDGDIVLMIGETNEELAEALDVEITETPSGYRDELDPVTGMIIRKKVEKPS